MDKARAVDRILASAPSFDKQLRVEKAEISSQAEKSGRRAERRRH